MSTSSIIVNQISKLYCRKLNYLFIIYLISLLSSYSLAFHYHISFYYNHNIFQRSLSNNIYNKYMTHSTKKKMIMNSMAVKGSSSMSMHSYSMILSRPIYNYNSNNYYYNNHFRYATKKLYNYPSQSKCRLSMKIDDSLLANTFHVDNKDKVVNHISSSSSPASIDSSEIIDSSSSSSICSSSSRSSSSIGYSSTTTTNKMRKDWNKILIQLHKDNSYGIITNKPKGGWYTIDRVVSNLDDKVLNRNDDDEAVVINDDSRGISISSLQSIQQIIMKARASDFTILSFDDDISECISQSSSSTLIKLNINNNNSNIINQPSSSLHADTTIASISTSKQPLHEPSLLTSISSYDQATIVSASLNDDDATLKSSEYHSPTTTSELASDTAQSTSISYRQQQQLSSQQQQLVGQQQQQQQQKQQQQKSYDIPIIQAPLLHQSYQNWIIFSDLHVKSSSIDICEQVLHDVHEDAIKRNAGIIFLGDFWHVRGTLSVELLNRVLKELNKWTQPVIMIPGNHDQVTLGGRVHALEPLLYAFPSNQILMIDEPSICMGALWLPYRRDEKIMQNILQSTTLKSKINNNEISMIFCHADVKGAFMNDGIRSRDGIDVEIFPKNIPIFSGHFHKPHTISKNKSTLRYVGSPYQTSLSEAGQDKYFYCVRFDYHPKLLSSPSPSLSAEATTTSSSLLSTQHDDVVEEAGHKSWQETERWKVSIGSKIIKASSPDDPLIDTAIIGDRVVVSIPIGQELAAKKMLHKLEMRGVTSVELRHEQFSLATNTNRKMISNIPSSLSSSSNSSIVSNSIHNDNDHNNNSIINDDSKQAFVNEELEPLRIFHNYMSTVYKQDINLKNSNVQVLNDDYNSSSRSSNSSNNVDDTSIITNESIHKAVMKEGIELIEKLSNNINIHHTTTSINSGSSNSRSSSNSMKVHNLRFDNVILSNFGPYAGEKRVNYPLSKRGLVLLRGQSSDGTGADSNGSGKTTLAMSIMWALTGSLDSRLTTDSRPVDVTYDANQQQRNMIPSDDDGTDSSSNIDATSNSSNSGRNGRSNKNKSSGRGNKLSSTSSTVTTTKLTAEVCLTGMINNKSFRLIRRRSSKKSELYFYVDDIDYTTQSVKDTQLIVDDILGTGKGLVERCCFFGQHSHTLHSLLGLTDVTLKKELSLLIDTTIWNKILQEIRTNEKNINNNINTINIEMKLRKEEINKNNNFVKKYENDLLLLDNELNLLMKTYNDTFIIDDVSYNKLNKSYSNSSGSNVSDNNDDSKNTNQVITDIDELVTKITTYEIKKQEIQSKRYELKKEILEPLRKSVRINEVNGNDNNKIIIEIEDKIIKLKDSIGELSLEKEQQQYIKKSTEQKIKKLQLQLNQINNIIIDLSKFLCYNNSTDIDIINGGSSSNSHSKSSNSHDGVDVDNYRRIYENSLSEITKIDVSIKQTNLSLSRLNNMVQIIDEVNVHTNLSSSSPSLLPLKSSSSSSPSSSLLSNTSSLHSSSSSSDYTCSTCGQDMPAESKEQRSNYLQHQLHHLNHDKQHHLNKLSQNKLNYDNSIILKTSIEKKEILKSQIDELNCEYNNSNIKYNSILEDINIKNITFTNIKNKKLKYDNEKLIIYNKNIKELDENENYDNQLAMDERNMQIDIDKYRMEKEKKLKLFNNIRLSISKLQENNIEIKNNIKYHHNIINDYQQILDKNDNLYQQLQNQLLIYEILSNIFSTKGIQNYIFSHIIKQLESISNAYLSVLADSGIQLSFQNDGISGSSSNNNNNDMIDRVIKSVYIRSKIDGNYRERSLSQLSGGQWRRVSLSLDLAFAELVRRRGLLRSNLIVMDEVLTHLDASGREAVGTVLRAMVSSDNNDNDDDDNDDDDYHNDIDGDYDNNKNHDDKNNIYQTTQSKKINYLNDWLFSGGSYETVIVILQDLAAAELEEAFDHIDIVVKESDSSSVLIEGVII